MCSGTSSAVAAAIAATLLFLSMLIKEVKQRWLNEKCIFEASLRKSLKDNRQER